MKSVIRGAGYVLAHTPDMVLHNGTTQTTERIVNPDSEYLKELPSHIRSFEQAVAYWPNQVYIGNKTPDELAAVAQPWCDKECDCHERYGKFGQMMPQNEFLLLMQACDVFDLVELEAEFVAANREALAANPVMEQSVLDRLKNGNSLEEIQRLVEEEGAEGLYHLGQLVGCVKRAHDIDANLSAHVMHENLVSKASSVLALLNVIHVTGIDRNQVEYVIDCAEEACGDINQRGGGNFAKSAAEIAGLNNASGSDCRAFCAAPAHAMIEAAALVASGAYHTVVVTAGGCTAKLGMNGKDHVKKGLPALEDMIGGFAVVITQDDGVNPFINLNMLGRHSVGTGSAPADALCRKYHELNKLYFGPDMISDDQIALEWARIPHFFYNYYVFQYATGFSAAVAIANRILKEGAPAVADYKKFLSGGCSTDPISLLKIAGVDMSSPEPVNSALALFGELVDELAELL